MRVAPPHERLDLGHLAAAQVDGRLEPQLQLAVGDGAAELAEQREPADRRALLGLGVDDEPDAGALRLVHRHIGGLHQAIRVLRVERHRRDADAGADLQVEPVHRQWPFDGLQRIPGDPLGRVRIGVGDEDRELVAAEPCDQLVAAEFLTQAVRDGFDQPVAVVVAERVVHVLEVVEIHQEQRHGCVADLGRADAALQPVAQHRPVRQPGERVVQREPS